MSRGIIALVLLLSLGAGGCGSRGGARAPVVVTDVWSRASPQGASVGVLYMTLTSAHGDRLIAVTVPAALAGHAEMHGVYHDPSGRLAMRALEAVDLPPRAPVAFHPGALHIKLMDLVKPLTAGERFDVTLRFRDAGEQVVSAVVRDE